MSTTVGDLFGALALGLLPWVCPAQKSDSEIIRSVVEQFSSSGLKFNCDSCEGAMNCYRYCNDLEFLRLDSLLDVEFSGLLATAPDDSSRYMLTRYQEQWTAGRREQCRIPTRGWTGQLGAVLYVDCLNELTRLRTNEVIFLRQSLTDGE